MLGFNIYSEVQMFEMDYSYGTCGNTLESHNLHVGERIGGYNNTTILAST